MTLLHELFEGSLKNALMNLIDDAIEKANRFDKGEKAIAKIMAEVKKSPLVKNMSDSAIKQAILRQVNEDDSQGLPAQGTPPQAAPSQDKQAPPKEEPDAPRVIAKAGDFKILLGQNEQVSLVDGKGQIRVSMPLVVWKELTRA